MCATAIGKSRFHAAFKLFQFQTACFRFLDVPIKSARNFAQPQRITRRHCINRQLQPASLLQVTCRNRRASRLVINHAQRPIGRRVESVNVSVQSHIARRSLQHQRRLAHPKPRLHRVRRESNRNLIQLLNRLFQHTQQLRLLLSPQRRWAKAILGGRVCENFFAPPSSTQRRRNALPKSCATSNQASAHRSPPPPPCAAPTPDHTRQKTQTDKSHNFRVGSRSSHASAPKRSLKSNKFAFGKFLRLRIHPRPQNFNSIFDVDVEVLG